MQNFTVVGRSLIDQDIKKIYGHFTDLNVTERQFSVLYLFANGYSDKEIAEHTNTTTKNIEKHMGIIKRRLEIGTRNELRMLYMTRLLGVISPC